MQGGSIPDPTATGAVLAVRGSVLSLVRWLSPAALAALPTSGG